MPGDTSHDSPAFVATPYSPVVYVGLQGNASVARADTNRIMVDVPAVRFAAMTQRRALADMFAFILDRICDDTELARRGLVWDDRPVPMDISFRIALTEYPQRRS